MNNITLLDRGGETMAVVRAHAADEPATWEISPGSLESARVLHEMARNDEPVWLEIEDIRIRGSLSTRLEQDVRRWFVRYAAYRPSVPLQRQPACETCAAG